MKKLAIFVEGKTEQIFVKKLLTEIAGKLHISIEIKSREKSNSAQVIMKDPVTSATKFYVLIYNSCRDESVVSDMRDQYNFLTTAGYERVIGLRDVYPIPIAEKFKLQRGLNYSLPKGSIPVNIVLAVMEIEAWFLAEYNHFIKIDSSLTPDRIEELFGFNPQTDDMEARLKPSDDIKQIYNHVGKGYNKSEKQLNRLAANLDYEFIYIKLVNCVPSLGEFIRYIDNFIIY
ncbi:MAG: DUF4276 family protein [Sphaerospermopsis kisseleviana]|uniref:DUF4276 family protein n=1 Tax=unclassified Sphaerospermopsis TaxID=2646443 RepID=UPI001680A7FA|nr:DUF4276 family protein [Sphaerospermopsis sp. FACHB-1094]MBD2146712.1 DUF4276 family protein [Sphaerospermopsis sp. FACHB-1194]MEB3149350.1 DUF4276 family protein [Sphaerospermopsis sp.]